MSTVPVSLLTLDNLIQLADCQYHCAHEENMTPDAQVLWDAILPYVELPACRITGEAKQWERAVGLSLLYRHGFALEHECDKLWKSGLPDEVMFRKVGRSVLSPNAPDTINTWVYLKSCEIPRILYNVQGQGKLPECPGWRLL